MVTIIYVSSRLLMMIVGNDLGIAKNILLMNSQLQPVVHNELGTT